MKKSILFAGLLMVSALFIGCNNDHSPETSSTKLWPAAMVSKDAQGIPTSKWGYIDAKGNFAIPASYMEAYEFSCGYALVRVSANSIFFVDEKNNMQNAPDFDQVDAFFYYDYVRYMTSSGLWGLLNKNFEIVIQPAYYDLGDMTGDGLVYFKQGEDSKYGYLDKNGETKIAPMYDRAWDFDAGYAVVNMGENYGVINKSGEATISLQSKRLRNLGGERIGFVDESSYKFGMMDAKGNIIKQPIYDAYSNYGFTDFDYMVVGIDGKYGYIDKNGKEVLAIQYAEALPFIEDKAFIARTEDADFECIDPKGKTLFTLEKDQHPVGAFHNGLCLVLKDTQTKREYKYINEKGAAVYSWSIESSNMYPAPAKAKGANRIDIDQYMAGTKWGYRAEKR